MSDNNNRNRRQRLRAITVTGRTALPNTEEDLPLVLFLEDLARLFRTSTTTIARRIADSTFPVKPLPMIDRRLRWSRQAVMEVLDPPAPGAPARRRPLAPGPLYRRVS